MTKRRAPIRLQRLARIVGPGIITGAADDDPSGIATCSQAGAQFGYSLLWVTAWELPLMMAVQEACARIGAVTGKGIAAVVRDRYHRLVLYFVVALITIANTFNIGADIGAVAAATNLVVPLPLPVLAVATVLLVLGLELFLPYRRYATVLKWLTLSIFAYLVVALIVKEPWGRIAQATFVPGFTPTLEFFFLATGVLGTTISPYMFFWQASEEVEEEIAQHRLPTGGGPPRISASLIRDLRIDNALGMTWSQLGSWAIIVATATVLNAAGVTNIRTAADAARALEPLVSTFPNAGRLAGIVFATGVLGLGLLGIPVLAGSASYAISEALGWREGLYRRVRDAPGFYAVIACATLIGLLLNFVGIDPVQALLLAAVVNGVVAVPLVLIIGRLAADREVMGDHRSGPLSRVLLWVTFAGMAASSIGMFYTLARG